MVAWVLSRLPSEWVIRWLCVLCREAARRWPGVLEDGSITLRGLAAMSFRKLPRNETVGRESDD